MNTVKRKHVKRSMDQVNRWIFASNFFITSTITTRKAVQFFNKLSPNQIKDISQRLQDYDAVRRAKLHGEKDIPAWEGSILADIHILAYEYQTDPLVVAMCINPICKPNEAVLIQR